jgi:hypothetical protein
MEAEFKNRKRTPATQHYKGLVGYKCRSLGEAMGQGPTLSHSMGRNDMAEKMGQTNRHNGYQGVEQIQGKMHQGKGSGRNIRKVNRKPAGSSYSATKTI